MKNLLKSFSAIMIALVACYYCPLVSFATFDIKNDNYVGTYDNLTNQLSYIEITKRNGGECNVSIVYSTLESKFITATHGSGYITNKRFYASFDRYIIKKTNGTTVKVMPYETHLSCPVEYKAGDYIDIKSGGIIYEKSL